jgi:hypothetical protein
LKFLALNLALCATLLVPAFSQDDDIPTNIADSVGRTLRWTESQFLSVAEAMPADKYSFVPSAGEFKGARSFAEQVKHVACAHFAFFIQIEGKTPPEHCERRAFPGQDQRRTGEVLA